ncbi:MAG: fimbrial protein [Limnohabitans sp.]
MCIDSAVLRVTKHFLQWAMLLFVGVSLPSQAAVTVSLSPGATLPLAPSGPFAIGRDKPVGTVLASASTTPSASGFTGKCQITQSFTVTGSETGPGSGVYSTGVAGIGVKFYSNNGGARTQITGAVAPTQTLAGPGALPAVEADLIVIGPVSTGALAALPLINVAFAITGSGNDGSCVDLSPATQGLQTTLANNAVTALTCTVTSTNIRVDLPKVSVQSLNASGKTAGATRFSIPLDCGNLPTEVYVTLTDATDVANTTSLLTLGSGATATNVKLEILKSDNSPVLFGPDSALAGTTNQWRVGAAAATTGVPLTVRYHSTGVATAGTVEAIATFTMSYQ